MKTRSDTIANTPSLLTTPSKMALTADSEPSAPPKSSINESVSNWSPSTNFFNFSTTSFLTPNPSRSSTNISIKHFGAALVLLLSSSVSMCSSSSSSLAVLVAVYVFVVVNLLNCWFPFAVLLSRNRLDLFLVSFAVRPISAAKASWHRAA